jgi:phosphoribosylformylglycinamidine synthase
MVGLINNERHITTQWFKDVGDAIILVGEIGSGLGGSRFLKVCHGRKIGPIPRLDFAREIAVQSAVRDLIRADLVKSAHDCSEWGLGVAVAECCFNPDGLLGAQLNLRRDSSVSRENDASHTDAATVDLLFNESQSRILISVSPDKLEKTLSELSTKSVAHTHIGSVSTNDLNIAVNDGAVKWSIAELHDLWFNSIRRAVESDSEPIPSL